MNKTIYRFTAVITAALLISACGRDTASSTGKNGQGNEPRPEWAQSIEDARAYGEDSPVLVVITSGGWGTYEKAVYESSDVKALLDGYLKVRLDRADTAVRKYGITAPPGLFLIDKEGNLITYLEGPRDPSVVARVLGRAALFPIPSATLSGSSDSAAHLRYVEVLVEQGRFDSALIEARRYLAPDTSTPYEFGQFLYAYASGEAGDLPEAKKWAARYLDRYPPGEFRPQVLWLMIVTELQSGNQRQARGHLDELIEKHQGSPYARQAVLAYSMEYLARGLRDLDGAQKLLDDRIEAGSPWADDFRVARAGLKMARQGGLNEALADLEAAAKSSSWLAAENAQEQLLSLAGRGDEGVYSKIVLVFQKLARGEHDWSDRAQLRLARLYLAGGDTEGAFAAANELSASESELADEAKLLSAVMELEMNSDPQKALARLEELRASMWKPEIAWPSRFVAARAHFFAGNLEEALSRFRELDSYFEGREFLPEQFSLVLGQSVPPEVLKQQTDGFLKKLEGLNEEEAGAERFQAFMSAVVKAEAGDSITAERELESYVSAHPASSLSDDALVELAKIYLRGNNPDSALYYLRKIEKSYTGSDQHELASHLVNEIRKRR